MAAENRSRRCRLSIEVDPELRRRIKIVAARKDVSIRDFIEGILRRALEAEEEEEVQGERGAWSRLSAQSFARDWDSEEDQEYDRLA